MQINKILNPIRQILHNLKKLLTLAWEMDKKLTIGYYTTAALSAVTFLATSIALAYLIDNLILAQNSPAPSIPLIILILLGTKYFLNLTHQISNWTLNQVYFDYLFRSKLQNHLSFKFYKKALLFYIAPLNPNRNKRNENFQIFR